MTNNLQELRQYLKQEYAGKLKLNPAYSKRAFSRDLQLSPTSLNDFLAGKRRLSYANIDKVFSYLKKKTTVCCSWCDKPKKEAKYMIGGPKRQFICDQCVGVCNEILRRGKRMER